MIARVVSVGSVLVEDMDSDGFHIKTEDGSVWISHAQLDDLVKLSALVREVNS
jgi:hypothetical protein